MFANLAPGDPAPRFRQRSTSNPNFAFDTAAGRYIVMCFFVSAGDPLSEAAMQSVTDNRHYFDDVRFCFFGVTVDPKDETMSRVTDNLPGIRLFWDFDGLVSRLYGSLPQDAEAGKTLTARRFWIVLDPTLRVLRLIPFRQDGTDSAALFTYLAQLPSPERFAGIEVQAPILFLPNVFETELCQHLISLYDAHGGKESGVMRDVNGKTTQVKDAKHKRRKDYTIEDRHLIHRTQARIERRVRPELLRIFSFDATRMERYIVSCYAAEDSAHFSAHRDNTTKGTAHRRFAISINLNSEFEGGEIFFPEYGPRSFKPPPGGAVVFPCALLHAVSRVTSGRRFAFLPFLYDEAASEIREQNNKFLDEGVGVYKAEAGSSPK